MPTIAERIQMGLKMRDMKQSDLVRITEIGKSSISTYLSGAYEPKQRNIYKIAKALDVNEAWLMGYDVSPDRKEPPATITDDGLVDKMCNNPDMCRVAKLLVSLDSAELNKVEKILLALISE